MKIAIPRFYQSASVLTFLLAVMLSFGTHLNLLAQDDHSGHEVTHATSAEAPVDDHHASAEATHEEGAHAEAHGDDHGGHSSPSPIFFIILALIIGTGTRHFLRKSPLPFTVMLLLIGLGLGVLERLGYFQIWNIGSFEFDVSLMSESIEWAAHIDPHMLLFVFLPILIFEAAFAMDVHTFKKTAINATILAIPGITIAMFATGALCIAVAIMGFGFDGWGWEMALMFGAVVSATDPVAVVALLKELGASKKLGTLIEGESLLNDGTAIVLFMVFFLGITGAAPDGSPIVEFLRVALGGVVIGLVLGWISLGWLKRVYNDAMVEIVVVIAAAYLAFFLAENTFKVSGVLALVALGIILGGKGRSRISPGVAHFMHEFWELAGFIANCLIFLIVGVVIAQRSVFTGEDFVLLGIIYIGIHVVRAGVIAMFYPFMRKAGYGLPVKDAIVVWYGALRGAIGLALALIVAGVDDKYIPPEIKDQFLFLTAGIVTLTLLVNATTIKFLVEKLGLLKVAPAKQQMSVNANNYVRSASETHFGKIQSNRYLKKADWDEVKEYLPEAEDGTDLESIEIETICELRRRILEKEKSSYWRQFKDGLLGPTSVRLLSDGISEVLDAGGSIPLSDRKDFEDTWETPEYLNKLRNLPLVGGIAERTFLDRTSISYDCAVGFVVAQEEALKLVESMYRADNEEESVHLPMIEAEINENRIHGQTFIRNLRKNYPDVYEAIATRQAIRNMLNYEKYTVDRLEKKGRIASDEAAKMRKSIEDRAKTLSRKPPQVKRN